MKQCKDKRNVQFGGGVTYNWIYDPYYSTGWTNKLLSCELIVQFVLPTLNHLFQWRALSTLKATVLRLFKERRLFQRIKTGF